MLLKSKLIKILLLLLNLLLLLSCSPAWQQGLRVSWLEPTRHKFLLYNGPTIELFKNKSVEQSFTANYPGLSRIDLLIRGAGHTISKHKLIFRLKSACGSTVDLVSLSVEAPVGPELVFYSFEFDPIDNSAGQSYCIWLQAPETTQENMLQLPLSAGDLYPAGRLQIYDPGQPEDVPSPIITKINGDLAYKIYLPIILGKPEQSTYLDDLGFQLHYKGLFIPTAQVFVLRLTANKPYLLGQPSFYGLLGCIYLGLLMGLFYLAGKMTRFC